MRPIMLALALLSPVVIHAQAPQRFRFESQTSTKSEMPSLQKKMADLSAMSGGDAVLATLSGQVFAETMTATISMTRRDSAGGTLWHAVIDSLVHDAGKMGEMLQSMGMAAAATASPVGASIDFFIKNGLPVGRVSLSLNKIPDLQLLGDELQAAFSIPMDIIAGPPKADSSFTDQPTPGQGNSMRTKTKLVTRRMRPTADSLALTTETLTNSDLGSTRGSMLSATTENRSWSLASDANLKSHLSKNEASVVMVIPFSGLQITQTSVTKTLQRVP